MIDPITEADIDWAIALMRLGHLDEPRRSFLRSLDTVDVSACPGSGKTTLLVAKLAILAQRWRHSAKGICVLSHTNVARDEIAARLGGTAVAHRLLGYPHFVGTIHSFVSRFLSTPYLLSEGIPVEVIDDDLAAATRRRILGHQQFHRLRRYLENQHQDINSLRASGADFGIDLSGRAFPAGPHTEMYQLARAAVTGSIRAGVLCYSEIFVFGRALLSRFQQTGSVFGSRFPIVLIDEMQDTSEEQNAFLRTLFPRTGGVSIVQRIGDPNQQIFDGDAAAADGFPDTTRCIGVPNSARFGQTIASRASPVAAHAILPAGLRGVGPIEAPHVQPLPTIFLFENNQSHRVLEAFGALVLDTLPPAVRESRSVAAIGAIHRPAPEIPPTHAHFPKTVSHYYPPYQHEAGRGRSPRPQYLCDYFKQAQASLRSGLPVGETIDLVAGGLRLAAEALSGHSIPQGSTRPHRHIERSLRPDTELLGQYRELLVRNTVDGQPLSQETWDGLIPSLRRVAAAIGGCDPGGDGANGFLTWNPAPFQPTTQDGDDNTSGNVYRFAQEQVAIDIELGSIHSVKGQTHCATLILETYHYGHDLQAMLPWLTGVRQNGQGAGERDRRRLLNTFVAMTRPTHLLCMAMRAAALGADRTASVRALEAAGWVVRYVAA